MRRAEGPRIALYGGTFDPPHRGHLAVAQAAAARFQLDRVLMAPVGRQPLKTEPPVATYADRLAMVRLTALSGECLQASDIDAPRADETPNYTIDSVRRLRSELGPDAEIFVIAGVDAFLTLPRWRASDELLRLARWIVVSRPALASEGGLFTLPEEALDRLALSDAQRLRVETLDDVAVPVSATELRKQLAEGRPCPQDLLPAVAEYISARRLYRGAPDPLP